MENNEVVIKKEQIDMLNEKYNVEIDPTDVQHYKLCQVILHLENELKKNN